MRSWSEFFKKRKKLQTAMIHLPRKKSVLQFSSLVFDLLAEQVVHSDTSDLNEFFLALFSHQPWPSQLLTEVVGQDTLQTWEDFNFPLSFSPLPGGFACFLYSVMGDCFIPLKKMFFLNNGMLLQLPSWCSLNCLPPVPHPPSHCHHFWWSTANHIN